jgi:hypothetical protein
MAKFNHSKPFGTVFGDDVERYRQAGVAYDVNFEPVGVEPDVDEDVDNDLLDAPTEPVVTAPIDTVIDPVDYQAMNWQAVKKLVEAAGGTWTNKIDGVAFLQEQ